VNGTAEAQMAISSPYICVGKDLYRAGPYKISAGGGFNYGIFNPGGRTLISIASQLGYQAYVELFRTLADNQKMVVKGGYVSYNGKSSIGTGTGDVTSAGYFLQLGMAYQL
ncbi:MAG TPA: hypothetical protein VMT55_01925, partial [Candidatus Sulfotelmatobacter sp.]|nr:hypothetical protein [Candidatus Sulfotelmatobacter sp.]